METSEKWVVDFETYLRNRMKKRLKFRKKVFKTHFKLMLVHKSPQLKELFSQAVKELKEQRQHGNI